MIVNIWLTTYPPLFVYVNIEWPLNVNFSVFYSILDQGHLRRMVLENCFLILFLRHTITVEGILEHLDVEEVKLGEASLPYTVKARPCCY